MSYITNVIFSFSILEDDEAVIAFANEVLKSEEVVLRTPPARFIPESEMDEKCRHWYGGSGTYALERPTFVAAFNYLKDEELAKGLAGYDWRCPMDAQLFVCGQDDEVYTERLNHWVRRKE